LIEAGPDLIAEDIACRRGERLVFTGVSFRLPAGGALMLSGANGSGKTSLLRVLATLVPPAAGRILWGNAPIDADLPTYRGRLHYVGHQDGVRPGLTPRETLLFWAGLRGGEARRNAPGVEVALSAFALGAVAEWPCRWLSAGQRRRLALARVVATRASIWLLDEPTTGLDEDNVGRLGRVIADHRAAGGRVVVASHAPLDIDAAAVLAMDSFAPMLADADAD
jgi:heme exporter protein A